LGVESLAEPGHVPRVVLVADRIQGLVPGREDFPGGRVEVVAAGLVPDGQLAVAVLDFGGWPPDLVIGRGQDLAQLGAGDGAPDRNVDVRGETALWLNGGEVLDVVPGEAAQVLNEPVEQRGEADRIPHGPQVVVSGRVSGRAVVLNAAVEGQVRVRNIDGRKVAPSGAV
jgi:hypothetical protein